MGQYLVYHKLQYDPLSHDAKKNPSFLMPVILLDQIQGYDAI